MILEEEGLLVLFFWSTSLAEGMSWFSRRLFCHQTHLRVLSVGQPSVYGPETNKVGIINLFHYDRLIHPN